MLSNREQVTGLFLKESPLQEKSMLGPNRYPNIANLYDRRIVCDKIPSKALRKNS